MKKIYFAIFIALFSTLLKSADIGKNKSTFYSNVLIIYYHKNLNNETIQSFHNVNKKRISTVIFKTMKYSPQSIYLKATIGNLTGMVIGGVSGVAISGYFWRKAHPNINNASHPDVGLSSIPYILTGFFSGGMLGSAIGTTIALRSGMTNIERLKIFTISLTPYFVPLTLMLSDLKGDDRKRHPTLFRITLGVSIPLSVCLPAWEYKRLLKLKNDLEKKFSSDP
jgi:hypothetical protein